MGFFSSTSGAARVGLWAARRWFPLTPLGVACTLLALGTWRYLAVPREDYVLQLVALMVLALMAVALLVLVPGVVRLRLARRRAARTAAPAARVVFEAHRGMGTLLTVARPRFPPMVETHWRWLSPPDFDVTLEEAHGRTVERVRSRRRAWVDRVTREWRVEDAFGLVKHALVDDTPTPMMVLPWTGRLDLSPLLRLLSSGEDLPHPSGSPVGDRADMRRYGPGDPLRLVLWKVYARTRTLMVRTPERALSPDLRVAVFVCTGPQDEPAAAAARTAVESGVLGEHWMLGTDGLDATATEKAAAVELVCRGAGSAGGGAGLAAFVARARDAGMQQLLVLMGTGHPADTVCGALRAWPGTRVVMLCTDHVTDGSARDAAWERWLRRPADAASSEARCTLADLVDRARALERAGASVTAVERPGGRSIALGQAAAPRRAA